MADEAKEKATEMAAKAENALPDPNKPPEAPKAVGEAAAKADAKLNSLTGGKLDRAICCCCIPMEIAIWIFIVITVLGVLSAINYVLMSVRVFGSALIAGIVLIVCSVVSLICQVMFLIIFVKYKRAAEKTGDLRQSLVDAFKWMFINFFVQYCGLAVFYLLSWLFYSGTGAIGQVISAAISMTISLLLVWWWRKSFEAYVKSGGKDAERELPYKK